MIAGCDVHQSVTSTTKGVTRTYGALVHHGSPPAAALLHLLLQCGRIQWLKQFKAA
jgi:hypothetical protein